MFVISSDSKINAHLWYEVSEEGVVKYSCEWTLVYVADDRYDMSTAQQVYQVINKTSL